jgi:hypothetical protein
VVVESTSACLAAMLRAGPATNADAWLRMRLSYPAYEERFATVLDKWRTALH